MDAQIERAHGHRYDQDPLHPHSAVEGEGDNHEKQSVLKKVKAKARKIKDSLGMKTHGHDEEDEYEEDEELHDPETTPGAPIYDQSPAAKKNVTGQHGTEGQPRTNLGPTSNLDQGPDHNVCPGTFQAKVTEPIVPARPKYDSGVQPNVGTDHNVNPEQFKGTSGQQDYSADKSSTNYQTKGSNSGKGVESAAPRYDTDQGDSAGQFKGTSGKHLDVDQNAPKNRPQDVSPANYGTKATNPAGTGTEEAGVAPILKSFGKMDISDEPQPKKEGATTDSHDRFSPTSDRSSKNKTSTNPDNTPVPKSYNASTENHPQDMNVDEPAKQQHGYEGVVSSVPSAITDKAISAKKEPTTTGSHDQFSPKPDGSTNKTSNIPENTPVPESVNPQDMNVDEPAKQRSGYTGTISSVTSALTDRAIFAKNVVASKIGYGTGSQMNKEGKDVVSSGVPMASTESGRGPAGQQSSYADKISLATSAITGKAVSAKDVVAAKLGYGEKNNPSSPTATGTDSDTHTITGSDMDRGTGVPVETGSGVGGNTGKGVGVQGYISEKLKPGEEDKALSEMISGAFNKRGKGVDEEEKRVMGGKGVDEKKKRAMSEVVSDGFHKRDNDDEMKIENKPMGKVTESEEVANRLGSSESEKLGKVSSRESSPRTGALDKVKGALTNWFGKGGETNPSKAFNDNSPSDTSADTSEKQDISTFRSNNDVSQDGERRLQESTN